MRACRPATTIVLLAFLAASASAEVIGVEQFDYTDGAVAAKNGGVHWDWKNTPPTSHTGVKSTWDNAFGAPVVTGGRLVTNNSGARREYNGNTETTGAVNDANVEKTVYYRATVTTGATLPEFFYFMSDDFGAERVRIGKLFGQSVFGVSVVGNADVNSAVPIQPNTTYTLVAKISYDANTVALFVNPTFGGSEPVPDAGAAFPNAEWSTAVRVGSGFNGDAITWDDLVVATTWSDLGTVVTTAADEDNGSLGGGAGVSLREAVKYSPSGFISFASGLSGQTITLTHADGDMPIPAAVTIDATALPGGLTVDGNNASRHFDVESGRSLTLRGLTLTRGNGSGGGPTVGGSVFNEGTLALHRCTVSDNAASSGGAIFQQGASAASLSHCTIAGNRATTGGIDVFGGTLTLNHCTISQNTGSGRVGGLFLQTPATVNVQFSIIAGNADPASTRPDIYYNGGTLNATGNNIIGDNTSVETQFPAGTYVGTAAAPKDPKLSPLGHFGGPVQTMHPLIGSLAIEGAGAIDIGGTDARGFPAFVDGDLNGIAARDIGAVEAGLPFRVENAGDAGGNTLRFMLGLAGFATNPGARITFDPALFPAGTITLGGTELGAPNGKSIFIDASNLGGSVTISGNNQSRVFNIPATATVAMHSVRIVNGKAADGIDGVDGERGEDGGNGGGILSAGTMSLFCCTLSGNAAGSGGGGGNGGFQGGDGGSGGGIFASGPLALTSCTLSGNRTGSGGSAPLDGGGGGDGGGIFASGPLALAACTLSGNSTGNGGDSGSFGGNGGSGGGIRANGPLALTACTVCSNRTGSGSIGAGDQDGSDGGGGGISGGLVTLQNCLIGLNTRGTGTPNDVSAASVMYAGANLLGTAATGTPTGPAPFITANPFLAPLGDYGGPTQTMALRPGSPARNAAVGGNEVQEINIGAFPVSFTLTFNGATTTTLNESSTAGQVQSALQALGTIGAGNVSVTRTVDGGNNVRHQVTFTGALAGKDQPPITDNGSPVVTTLTEGYPAPAHRSDQRGFPIVGVPDIGAYEAGTLTNYNAFIWETLPNTATAPQAASTFDFDGDGSTNGDEYTAGTIVTDPLSVFRITQSALNAPNFTVTFPTVIGRNYQLQSSPDLAEPWTNVGSATPGTGGNVTLPANVTGFTRHFFRINITP